MEYLRVKNWAEFQHYKDRNPPWIKLHRTLLDDYEFSCLQDASKAHLMLIWLFASQRGGLVPDDPKFLKMKLGLQHDPNLKWFIDQGLLIPEHNASAALAPCEQVAPREEKRRNKNREFDPLAIELPEWLERLVWGKWVADRKDRRKPITERAAAAQIAKLAEYKAQGHSPESVIDHSIAGGYQGLFPPSKPKQADSPIYRREGVM